MTVVTTSAPPVRKRSTALRRAGARWGALIVSFVVLMIVWQGGVTLFNVPPFVLPAPSTIIARFAQDVTSASVWGNAGITLIEVVAGFAVAAFFGLLVGSIVALNALAERIIYPYVLAFQTVPKVALAPLLIIWAGFGIQSKIVTAALIAFFPILVNVITGLKSVEGNRILLMRALKASPWQTFCKVRLPAMLPFYIAGLEIGIVFAMIGAIVGEFIGAPKGLGMLIVMRQGSIDVAGVFSILIFLSLLGIALNLILKAVSAPYIAWSRELK